MIRRSFRAKCVIALACFVGSAPVHAEECTANFGDPVAFDRCAVVELPDLEIAQVRVYSPDSAIPMACREYEARPLHGPPVKFETCDTGALGGFAKIRLGPDILTVLYDTPFDCIHSPAGNWVPRYGHRFYKKSLSDVELYPIYQGLDNQDQACRSRPNAIWVPSYENRSDPG